MFSCCRSRSGPFPLGEIRHRPVPVRASPLFPWLQLVFWFPSLLLGFPSSPFLPRKKNAPRLFPALPRPLSVSYFYPLHLPPLLSSLIRSRAPGSIGRLEVGSETSPDRSKAIKTSLMRLLGVRPRARPRPPPRRGPSCPNPIREFALPRSALLRSSRTIRTWRVWTASAPATEPPRPSYQRSTGSRARRGTAGSRW